MSIQSNSGPEQRPYRMAIVGGGITGLSAAWYAQQAARRDGVDLRLTVLEASARWGGKVLTETVEGDDGPFVVEGGPDSFLTQKPWALELAGELGLDAGLIGTNERRRQTYVLVRGKLVPLPEGVMMIVPTKLRPFALSPLISPLGKLRMGLDLVIPPKRDDADESLGDFIRRRLGSEALDRIAEPLMSGIYNADADQQSLLATFPRFRAIEKQYGSLIRGMIMGRRPASRAGHATGAKARPPFMTFRGGTGSLIDALVTHIDAELRLNTPVRSVEPLPDGGYHLTLDEGESLDVDALLLATPAYVTSRLIAPFVPDAANELAQIRYVSTGTISLAYHESDIRRRLNGFGLVIPRTEQRAINAVTLCSIKFDCRAPEGDVLLRAFFGGARSPQSMALDDVELLATVRAELKDLLQIDAEPLFHRIYRWHDSNAQYDVDHLRRVERIDAALPRGLTVAGSAFRGVGLPDCVHDAQRAVAAVVDDWKRIPAP